VEFFSLRHRIRFQEGHWKPNVHHQKRFDAYLIRIDNEIPVELEFAAMLE
jgi:hypothetical protein